MARNRNWTSAEIDQVVAFVVAGASDRTTADLVGAGSHSTITRLRARPDVAARIEVARAQLQSDAEATAARRARADERDRDRQRAERDADFERRASGQPLPVPDEEATDPEYRPLILTRHGNERVALTEEHLASQRPAQPAMPEAPTRKRRPRSLIVSSVGTIFQSPLDSLNQAHARGGQGGFFAPASPPADWLDDRDRLLVARDGKRVFTIDPSLRAEYEADGFVVA